MSSEEIIHINLEIDNTQIEYNTKQLIVFKQGGEEYGLEIDQIREVVLTPYITKMPHTPSYIKGVANIRGSIIAIVDLEDKFNVTGDNEDKISTSYSLVVENEEFKIGILVREVPNTLSVAESDIDDTMNLVEDNSNSGYIKGIVKKEGRLIILLDIHHIMTSCN